MADQGEKSGNVVVDMKPSFSLILFDGVCNLCNDFVQFVIPRDPGKIFKFASLQSNVGIQTLDRLNLPRDLSTIVLVEPDDTFYLRSSAALKILSNLKLPYSLLYGFYIVPSCIRDSVYNLVAANRYRFWGKKDSCNIMPGYSPDRFLNNDTGPGDKRN